MALVYQKKTLRLTESVAEVRFDPRHIWLRSLTSYKFYSGDENEAKDL